MMQAAEVQVFRDLDRILPEWQELLTRCSDSTPFQSPGWLLPWWRVFGTGDPLIVTVRKSNRLVGLGLFYIYRGDADKGPQLFLVGKSVSDYLDILVADNEHRDEVAQQILDYVFELTTGWNTADLDRLRSSSPLLKVKSRPGFVEHRVQDGVCPELPLKGCSIREIATKNTRDSIRKHRNRARSFGHVEFVSANLKNFPALFDNLVHLHLTRWRSVGLPGIFSDHKMVRFLSEAGTELLRSGTLQLHAMQLNGTPVAVAFGMLHRERHYFYLCDFHPDYASISPGTLVTAHAMEQAAQRGARYFDFLQGEEPYKYQKWGAQPRHTYRIQYCRESIAPRPTV